MIYFYSRTEKTARAKENILSFGRVLIEEDKVNESKFGVAKFTKKPAIVAKLQPPFFRVFIGSRKC